MKLAFSLLGLTLFASLAHAESVYTCTEARGDSIIIEMSRQGENMFLRTPYRKLNFTQSKRRPKKSDYFTFVSSHGVASLQESVVRGDSGAGVVGNLLIEGHVYPCKVGEGKLTVSAKTRREFSGRGGGGGLFDHCGVRSHYQGMTFMPPRWICTGNGVVSITSINRGLPFR